MTRMSLDNRPTKIVVKDIPQDSTEIELRQHFEVRKTLMFYQIVHSTNVHYSI